MIQVKCGRCGRIYPKQAGHDCGANDNKPYDDKAWRRVYMREYMRRRRERLKAAGGG